MGRTEAPQAISRPAPEPGTTRYEMLLAFFDPEKWGVLLQREKAKKPAPTPVPTGGRVVTA